MRSLLPTLAVLLAFPALPAITAADAISPPPVDCPAGATPTSTHAGTWCEASSCNTDAECSGRPGTVCRAGPLCVRIEPYEPGGMHVDVPGQPPTKLIRHVGVSTCDDGCPQDAPCQQARRCVAPTLTEMFTPGASDDSPGGCGSCTIAPRPRPTRVAPYACVVLLALLLLRAAASRRVF